MSKTLLYYCSLVLLFFMSSCTRKSKLPDLKESYFANDTRPFGGKIAFSILQNSFPDTYVLTTKLPFDESAVSPDTSALYFCLARNFYAKEYEAEAIMDYIYKGNTFFLSAENIDSQLLDKMYCKMTKDPAYYYSKTSVKLIGDADSTKNVFSYYYRPFNSSFPEINEVNSRIVGYNNNDDVNCIVYFFGKGKLFLHSDPRAFSNYFLLKNNNYRYMQGLLQLTVQAPEHVYWNDYYCRQNDRSSGNDSPSALDGILKYPPLASAFWIALLLLSLFILFGIKRKQRVIKQIQPNVNSSVVFTETIARLYLQQNDNKNIAEKMISYFNEFIRSNYFLHVNAGSDDFIKTLSRKSGVSLESITSLYRAISHANGADKIDNYQLLSLNEQIQQFYKKRK